ncbi:uncharacterized protein [Henckelia pumila]|uniref:uncharacterized protein n=1 Tax=Henckelia pumila TaxID=405737 RepID=UPI003C6E97F4
MIVTKSQKEEPEKSAKGKETMRPNNKDSKEDKRRSAKSSTTDALAQISSYARFLKEILTNKRKLNDLEKVTLNEECSVVLQNKLPPKFQDPRSFCIPCKIRCLSFDNVLCDLGARINLMPYSLPKKLGLGAIEPTSLSLKLVDRSMKYPRGIVKNVLVKVDKLIFPIDFIIFDMDDDYEVPLILGRPFIATSRALIDVEKGELVLRMNDQQIVFNMLQSVRDQSIVKSYFEVDVVDDCVSLCM